MPQDNQDARNEGSAQVLLATCQATPREPVLTKQRRMSAERTKRGMKMG
jgi:hypothetical protein